MFHTVEGIRLSNLTGIEEAFSCSATDRGYHTLTVNVSAEHISPYFCRLVSEIPEPMFFLIEVPAKEDEEKQLRKNNADPLHKQVYYLDGLSKAKVLAIFHQYERLFVHEGLFQFGIGAHKSHDEVFVAAYKVFEIYADHPEKYVMTLQNLGLPRRERLKTVWDNISAETPATRQFLQEKPSVWDMIDALKESGLYLAETRVD